MLWTLLIAAAQPAVVADPAVIALVAGEGNQLCLPDKSLCFDLPAPEVGGHLQVASPGGEAGDWSLPFVPNEGDALTLWPHLIAVPPHDGAAPESRQYLIGVVTTQSAMYSGGGGSGSRLHLLRLDTSPSMIDVGDEVLDVVWDSSLLIRACFSEKDMEDRLGACHDDYGFKATLTVAPHDGGELPALTYRSFATAYPQTSRRTEDNSGQKLKKSDLAQWSDPECSYTRTLRYNPATSRYEMDRPAPDCSSYTTP
ncbi:hypothetical protein [Sphingopyxis sp. R3-92]|uniref:hypothetical protein n=1 Tax=Sphingopyxis sp. R3-92 TaxID=3158553 RepID=UPI003EE514D9